MRQERRLKMEDAIFFRFEEKASAYRMYYEEDVEIEVQGKKYRQKKGKGPLCEDVMSFSDGDVCIIDKDIFIPKEVYIGNNVVIRKGTGFFVERNSGFVEIKDNTVIEGSKIHATVDKASKMQNCRVQIKSSKIIDSIIEDSVVLNSEIVDSCTSRSKVEKTTMLRTRFFDGKMQGANIADSEMQLSQVTEGSTISELEAQSVVLHSSILKGKPSEPITIRNIGFSHSRIENNFPNDIIKENALTNVPVFENVRVKNIFDACFIRGEFFYKRINLYNVADKYEYGNVSDGAIVSKTVFAPDAINGGLDPKTDESDKISLFAYKNVNVFLRDKVCSFPEGLSYAKYSIWRNLYSNLIKNYIVDTINKKDSVAKGRIMKELHIDISKKSFSGDTVFIDSVTFEMIKKEIKFKTENVVLI